MNPITIEEISQATDLALIQAINGFSGIDDHMAELEELAYRCGITVEFRDPARVLADVYDSLGAWD